MFNKDDRDTILKNHQSCLRVGGTELLVEQLRGYLPIISSPLISSTLVKIDGFFVIQNFLRVRLGEPV